MYSRILGLFSLCNENSDVLATRRTLEMSLLDGYHSDDEEEPAWLKEHGDIYEAYKTFYSQIDKLKKQEYKYQQIIAKLYCCNTYQLEQDRAKILEDFMADLRKATSIDDALLIVNREKRNPSVTIPLDRDKITDGTHSYSLELLLRLEAKMKPHCAQQTNDCSMQLNSSC